MTAELKHSIVVVKPRGSIPQAAASSPIVRASKRDAPGAAYSSARNSGSTLTVSSCSSTLLDHGSPELRIRKVAKVLAFIDESPAAQVDDDAERVGLLRIAVGQHAVAVLGSVAVPLRCMAAVPLAVPRGADFQQKIERSAGVVRSAAHFRGAPLVAEMRAAPSAIRLESAGGKHGGVGGESFHAVGRFERKAHAVPITPLETNEPVRVHNRNAVA